MQRSSVETWCQARTHWEFVMGKMNGTDLSTMRSCNGQTNVMGSRYSALGLHLAQFVILLLHIPFLQQLTA